MRLKGCEDCGGGDYSILAILALFFTCAAAVLTTIACVIVLCQLIASLFS